MKGVSRIEIKTIDRSNMTYDISSVFAKYNINIIWMEVYTYVVYIKISKLPIEIWEKVKKEIKCIDGVQEIKEIDLITLEKKELEIKTVMDIVDHGVIILSKKKEINYINKYALENVFEINSKTIVYSSIRNLIPEYYNRITEKFKDIEKKDKPLSFEITINDKNFILSLHSIKTEANVCCGYLMIIQDLKKVKEIFNSKRYNNRITFQDIIGNSQKITRVISQAKTFALSDSPVLIMGESGTGKELFARAIHNMSNRATMPFIAINCGAIPDQLLESELFGYEKGSFTGAKNSGKTGLFEEANGGTIFLDEIGEMPPHLQVKLLRVIQDKKVRKIGSNKSIDINVRIISATNRDIKKMIEINQFRLDLFYRINIFTLLIPSLRERRDDIEVLIHHLKEKYASKYNKNILKITDAAQKKLINHRWEGNVRELENVVERAVALISTKIVTENDIVLDNEKNKEKIQEFKSRSDWKVNSLKETLGNIEREIIVDSLKQNGSIRKAAKALDTTHTLLINRIRKYSISDSEWRKL